MENTILEISDSIERILDDSFDISEYINLSNCTK